MSVAKITPVVDGSGLKNTLEKEVIRSLAKDARFQLCGKNVLLVCGMDRFGMAEALEEAGCKVTYGDLIFSLDKDQPIRSIDELEEYAERLLPEVVKLPIGFIYPIGKKQESPPELKYTKYYDEAEIICGDFHFIRKFMPPRMDGKIIITNTVTSDDIADLKERGLSILVTTTPELGGRSFGTNVIEAVFITLLQKKWDEVRPEDYLDLIRRLDLKPRIEVFN